MPIKRYTFKYYMPGSFSIEQQYQFAVFDLKIVTVNNEFAQ